VQQITRVLCKTWTLG